MIDEGIAWQPQGSWTDIRYEIGAGTRPGSRRSRSTGPRCATPSDPPPRAS